jgi:TrmH family RNA methyltransferase
MSSSRLNRFRPLLVGTKTPENIGSFARLLENFEITEAGLVAPNCDWREGVAQWMATGTSKERLNSLPVHDSLADAVSDCQFVVGFTARAGRNRRMSIRLEDVAGKLDGRVALVFGREDFCLLSEEVDLCTHLCALDTSPHFPALNLSHSVAVVLSDLFRQEGTSRRGHLTYAPAEELAPVFEHLRNMMLAVGLDQDGNPDRMLGRLKKIFQRAGLTREDLGLMRGLFSRVIAEVASLRKGS